MLINSCMKASRLPPEESPNITHFGSSQFLFSKTRMRPRLLMPLSNTSRELVMRSRVDIVMECAFGISFTPRSPLSQSAII